MALVVTPEDFCIFKAQASKLANGHQQASCPQCQALRRLVVEVNNSTLDMIAEIFNRCKPGTTMSAEKIAAEILKLKSIQS